MIPASEVVAGERQIFAGSIFTAHGGPFPSEYGRKTLDGRTTVNYVGAGRRGQSVMLVGDRNFSFVWDPTV